jgi:CubicO group peptidase (beta-lactamase class C family)
MATLSTAQYASITARFPDLETVITGVMAEWHIPGLALALVRQDAPPLLQVFGLSDTETGKRVETSTLFSIGSITKSVTATGLALLVDEGKLGWDVPVREILPEFRLKDPIASEKSTLRDLLTHRTGLPRHDWIHTPGHLDNAGMLAALRHLELSKEFRSAYQYNNLMYLVAGMLAERIAGQRWEDFTRSRILDPLGMATTATSLEEMVSHFADYAAPHLGHALVERLLDHGIVGQGDRKHPQARHLDHDRVVREVADHQHHRLEAVVERRLDLQHRIMQALDPAAPAARASSRSFPVNVHRLRRDRR